MIKFENTIYIEKPVNNVFAFVSDFKNIPKWNHYVEEVKQRSEDPISVGTTYHQFRKTDDQLFKITEFEFAEKVTIETLPQSNPVFTNRFIFEPVKGGTKLIDKWELDTNKPFLFEKLTKIQIKNAVMDNLKKLKQLLETGETQLKNGKTIKR